MKTSYKTIRNEKKKKINNDFFRLSVLVLSSFGLIFVALIIVFLFTVGISGFFRYSNLNFADFLFGDYYDGKTAFAAGFMIINTLWVTFLAVIIALTISIFTAMFITRIAPKKLRGFFIMVIAILAAIPSVIYGAFGANIIDGFVINTFGAISGSVLTLVLTLAIMIMPTITIITIGSINAVNKNLEYSSLALGATKSQTTFFVTLKAARKGIIAGAILGVGRALGEATAVSMISSAPYFGPTFGLFEPIRLLTATMLNSFGETAAGTIERASMYAMAMLLMITILLVFLALKLSESFFDETNKAKRATKKILYEQAIWDKIRKYGVYSLSFEEQAYYKKMAKKHQYQKLQRKHNLKLYKKNKYLNETSVNLVENKQKTLQSKSLSACTIFFSCLGILFLVGILLFLLIGGLDNLTWAYISDKGVDGLAVPIYGTFLMIILTMPMAMLLGISSGIYFSIFGKKNRFNKTLGLGIDMLAGIPSLIFGLVGFVLFYPIFGPGALGMAPLAGAVTMTFIVLPTIIKTTEEAILNIPSTQMSSSLGLGATKTTSAVKVALPQAMPQITSGLILSIGRIIGESAALVMIFGLTSQNSISDWTHSGGTTLATQIYALTKAEVVDWDLVKTIGIVIIIIIFLLILGSNYISKKQWIECAILNIGILLMLISIFIGSVLGLILFIFTVLITLGLLVYIYYGKKYSLFQLKLFKR